MAKKPKPPPHADISQLARSIVDAATNEADDPPDSVKASSGRLGGQIGGKARADSLSAKRRAEIARQAARKRWSESRSTQEEASET